MKTPFNFISEAADVVKQRGTDNGYDAGQERSAAKIAEVFNALTGHQLTEADAWTFLMVLKLVRNRRKFKPDNIVDLIGYAGLLGECLDSAEQHTHAVTASEDDAIAYVAPTRTAGVRPYPVIWMATGDDLDRYAEMVGVSRHTRNGYATDTAFRGLIVQAANDQGICLHPTHADKGNGLQSCECCGALFVLAPCRQ